MATNYGLLEAGFFPMTLTVIRERLQEAVRTAFGASFKVGDKSITGQIIGIIAEALALVWEMAEAVNSSQDPDKATGAALDALAALTGTFRTPASFSTATLTLTGDDGTVVTALSQARTASTQQIFETQEDATLAILDAWVGLTAYVIGDRVYNPHATRRCYICTTSGTTEAAVGGNSGDLAADPTGDDVIDGTAHWRYLGDGDSAVDVLAAATETGPIEAASGDINEKVSAVSGWSSVINLLDAEEGRDQATDAELREDRERELSGAGTSPIDAIRADLLQLSDDIEAVRVFVNNTDSTDADGVPPHAVEALVLGGEDQEIFNQLLASVAAGIATHGTEVGSATDSQGTDHVMKFSRPDDITIYVEVDLIKDPDTYEGDAAVELAVSNINDDIEADEVIGLNAVASRVSRAVFNVEGVLDVTDVRISITPNPTVSTTIVITNRQIASYDTSNVDVTSVDGTP